MARFKELGFENFDDYKNCFFNTLLKSNKTFDYFVDWDKVKTSIKKYLNEISLLNSLTKVDTISREEHFQNLLIQYPKVAETIPLLIAERVKSGKIDIFDPNIEELITFEFKRSKVNKSNANKIVEFCRKTGILDLFQEIKDIHDYLLGVEVGLDTNARKNRSGDIFEKMCQHKIKKLIANNYIVVDNDPNFSLYPIVSKERNRKNKAKTHDVVVYKNDSPILIVECNFYNRSGSKPISIAESYIEMNRIAQKQKLIFIWVTDGKAWHQMKEPLLRSMKEIDWILNYRMLDFISKILR